MASVSWVYPAGPADRAAPAERGRRCGGADRLRHRYQALNFRYQIEGDKPAWRPLRPSMTVARSTSSSRAGIAQGEMPPLFVIGAEGDAELVNYRVQGDYMIVDRLFAAAELRLGGEHQKKVRIVRTDGRPQS